VNAQTAPEPGKLPQRPTLSVCMIVRDEEEVLRRCLNSVQGVADELIVVDTGSKDDTISIAESFGAKVFHFDWCDDFASARNESLKHATGDWILVIDADEELVPSSIDPLRESIARSDALCYVVRCDNGPGCVGERYISFTRLVRRHPAIRFRRPYHEELDSGIRDLVKAETEWRIRDEPRIVIRHHGYTPFNMPEKLARGLRIMRSYIQRKANDAYILTKLGGAYFNQGDYDEAASYLSRAIVVDPEYPEANYALGLTLEKQNKPDAAVNCFIRAIAGDPNLTEARANLAAIFVQKGMYDDAISQLQKALCLNPELAVGHSVLGLAYIKKNMYKEGLAALEKAVALDPNLACAHMNLAIGYTRKGLLDDALAQYEKALAIDPDYAKAHYNLAVTYCKMGNHKKAVEHCDKATELGVDIHPKLLEWLRPFR
jgi:tetratricopeptide (TPR) repeat protein